MFPARLDPEEPYKGTECTGCRPGLLQPPQLHRRSSCHPRCILLDLTPHVRPAHVPTVAPRRLTEETLRVGAAAVPLMTYDFLDFNIGPQVRHSIRSKLGVFCFQY